MIINHFYFTIFLGGGEGLGIEEWPHACIITTIIIITIFLLLLLLHVFPGRQAPFAGKLSHPCKTSSF